MDKKTTKEVTKLMERAREITAEMHANGRMADYLAGDAERLSKELETIKVRVYAITDKNKN